MLLIYFFPIDQAEEEGFFVELSARMSERVPFSRVPQQPHKRMMARAPLFRFLNNGLIAGAHSLGYVSCASKKGNTPAGARTGAFDFRVCIILIKNKVPYRKINYHQTT